jgi:hypothetical protein
VTNFAGNFDCANAVEFAGTMKDKILLARFQTTALTTGSAALSTMDE